MHTVSYIIPCYNSSDTIENVVLSITLAMKEMKQYSCEIILVNDGSSDSTYKVIERLCKDYSFITGIDMAKNFGQPAAIMAGLRIASGDILICLDDDGQTPADEAYKLIQQIEDGSDVVYASYTNKKHSLMRNMGSKLNDWMMDWLLNKPRGLYLSSYFAMRRYIVDEILRYINAYPYIEGLILRATDNIVNVPVKHRERIGGVSGYNPGKLVSLWMNGFTAFSVKPLRIAVLIGGITAFMGFGLAVWTIISRIKDSTVEAGWSSIVSILLVLGGIILCELGLIGEYIGRSYICLNNAPQYVVRKILRNGQES